jgi:hypothetical protein
LKRDWIGRTNLVDNVTKYLIVATGKCLYDLIDYFACFDVGDNAPRNSPYLESELRAA